MISFPAAVDLLLKSCDLFGTESCLIDQAQGRILRADIVADRDSPAFDRVMMDGYALRFSDWAAGQRRFALQGSGAAGQAQASLAEEPTMCLEIMTGAPCPVGADLIIPIEVSQRDATGHVIFPDAFDAKAGNFIHRSASDAKAGEVLISSGTLLGSREIGVAASCGVAVLTVSKKPKIAVIATGDELVAVDEIPAPHQIRQSNAHSLTAALARIGHPPADICVLKDEPGVANVALAERLNTHDVLVLTGAVSMGSRDFIPRLLGELGCEKLFHGVAHRPGKPAGAWRGPSGQVIVALPGNPVSALTGLHVFVVPLLAQMSSLLSERRRLVTMENDTSQLIDFTRHLPITLGADGRAIPAPVGNSGDFIGLLKSSGFVTLPPRGSQAVAFPYTPWL